jgi:hypothetical protein
MSKVNEASLLKLTSMTVAKSVTSLVVVAPPLATGVNIGIAAVEKVPAGIVMW